MKTDNELIAEFMGLRFTVDRIQLTDYVDKTYYDEDDNIMSLQYDTSWDWLMPVVEKINGLNHVVQIYPTRARFYKTNMDFIESVHPGYSLIEVVYCGVVEFIKWYNQQKP